MDELTIYPATHYITTEEKMKQAIVQIKTDLEVRLKELRAENKLLEAQRLEQRTRYDLEMMEEMGFCQGIENYSRYLTGREPGEAPSCLLDYFPDDFLLFIDESHVTIPQIGGMYAGDQSRKSTLVNFGFRLPSALDNRPLNFREFENHINQAVYVSATPAAYELKHAQQVVEQIIRPTGLLDPEITVRPIKGQIDDLMNEIRIRIERSERVLVVTLTKRMAEDLTQYFKEAGISVQYIHSDVETIQRSEALRDLRLGKYDVLVGINLLREGLDLPEVSLVAILDADKEGFLRSATSLIQTVGRAARNVNGQVIMYADRITDSMAKAISETERRRKIQLEYNEKHGITPETVKKAIRDLVRSEAPKEEVDEEPIKVDINPEEAMKLIKNLERSMLDAAKKLEFEEAAKLRDEIAKLRKELGLSV